MKTIVCIYFSIERRIH